MDHGSRHETSRLETKNVITCGTASSMSFMWLIVPLARQVPWDTELGPGGCCTHGGSLLHLKNPKIRKIQPLIMSCKQTCQTFALEEDIIFTILGTEQTLSLLWVYLITFLEKIVCHKISQFLCLQDVQKPKRTLDSCLPTITIRFNFKFHSIFLPIPEGVASILNYLGIPKCIMVFYVSQCLCLLPWEDLLTFHSIWCPQICTCYVSFFPFGTEV